MILPDETITVLNRVTSKGTRSTFISRAVLHYVDTHSRQAMRKQLEAGYRANADRNLAMTAEWFPLEEEVSQRLALSEKTAKAPKTNRK